MTKLALVPLLAVTRLEIYTKHRLGVGTKRDLLRGLDRPEKGCLLLFPFLFVSLLLLAGSLLAFLVESSF